MGRLLRSADRVLLHPWTSRWGGIQAITGAGVLAAGLVGGAVSLLLGFPLGWAMLTAAGAALVASSGAATAIDGYRNRQEGKAKATANDDSRRAFRRAIRAIGVELVANRDTLREIESGPFVRTSNPLRTVAWTQHEGTLLDHPDPEPYRVGSDVYRELRAADNDWYLFSDPTREHQPADITRYEDAERAIAGELIGPVEVAIRRLTDLDDG